MFNIIFNYYCEKPKSVENSPLKVKLNKKVENNLAIYDILIKNKENNEQGMVIYEFFKPSCYDFNINDLEGLRLNNKVDYFEILENNSKLVFHFRGMEPKGVKEFTVSLYKRFKLADEVERTHCVYLYYDKEGSEIFVKAE